MSEDYYKARIGELSRELEAANAENVRLSGKSGCCIECERLARENESLTADLEAAHAELGQYGADIKMLEKRNEELGTIVNQYDYAEECQDEQKLWEWYKEAFFSGKSHADAVMSAYEALKVWKERK